MQEKGMAGGQAGVLCDIKPKNKTFPSVETSQGAVIDRGQIPPPEGFHFSDSAGPISNSKEDIKRTSRLLGLILRAEMVTGNPLTRPKDLGQTNLNLDWEEQRSRLREPLLFEAGDGQIMVQVVEGGLPTRSPGVNLICKLRNLWSCSEAAKEHGQVNYPGRTLVEEGSHESLPT
ncbi:hypothetical protein GWI33_017782 [Rhynchophorus ferrugineus]|uniref:Uncharacterized protein n=1 Tax=Rhynchophorus ferrugineus TaxID=354439 RepID=A0A834M5W2_RHYFE|nr:hypothetical protein GWI33_017782 [Rhynchophorus ferrugineus]